VISELCYNYYFIESDVSDTENGVSLIIPGKMFFWGPNFMSGRLYALKRKKKPLQPFKLKKL